MLPEILTAILLFCCVLLTCIPTVPGIPLMFIITVVYGLLDGFTHLQPSHLFIFGAITLVSVVIDWSSGLIGAKLGGATRKSLFVGIIGMIIGLLLFPPLGAFLGLFLGVFIAQLLQFNDHALALKSATSSVVATIVGVMANVVLAVGYFVTFLILVF